MKPLRLAILAVIVFGIFARLLDHPPNFTPVLATAIIAGLSLKNKGLAIALPLLIMWLSDLVLTNVRYAEYYTDFQLFGDAIVYLAMGLVALLPYLFSENLSSSWLRLGGIGLTGSVLFFVVTNFGTWLTSGMYPMTGAGLVACFVAAIPFFHYTLAGTLLFGAVGVGILRFVASQTTAGTEYTALERV